MGLEISVCTRSPRVGKTGHGISRFRNRASSHTSSCFSILGNLQKVKFTRQAVYHLSGLSGLVCAVNVFQNLESSHCVKLIGYVAMKPQHLL